MSAFESNYEKKRPPYEYDYARHEVEDDGMGEIREAFKQIAGPGGEVDAYELQEVLNQVFTHDFECEDFSADLCRSMVAMRDLDLTGNLEYEEFIGLWKDLSIWEAAFKQQDTDGNGYFTKEQFAEILTEIGLDVEENALNAICVRYSDREGKVRFNDYIACAVKLKSIIETYKSKDPEGEAGEIEFELDEFIQMTMYT